MNEEEVRRRIFEILHGVAPEANLDRIGPDENLREALDIDRSLYQDRRNAGRHTPYVFASAAIGDTGSARGPHDQPSL